MVKLLEAEDVAYDIGAYRDAPGAAHLVRRHSRHRRYRSARALAPILPGSRPSRLNLVLISDQMDPKAAAIFRDRGIHVDEITGQSPDELKQSSPTMTGLPSARRPRSPGVARRRDQLKVVGRAGIGVDNVDIPAAARGVVVMNTPFGNSITTAEHAVALIFALARQLPEADASTQAGKWEKNRFMGVEVTGKTLGLIGAGNIGSIVATRARSQDEGRRL